MVIALVLWGVFFYTQLRAETNVKTTSLSGWGSELFDILDDREIGGMDYDGVNPGNDKRQCLSYEECPEWDGNPDTKVFYDLMKLPNGTGKVETDFNWNVHVYLCHQNKLLDSINGEGSFEKRAIQSAKDGMIPCPIVFVNPHWTYDWENHILQHRINNFILPKSRPNLGIF